jgi:hypothetical protein
MARNSKPIILIFETVKSFRSAYCDVSMPPEGLREFLPRLIPVYVFLVLQISAAVPLLLDIISYIPIFFPRLCCRTWYMRMMMSLLMMLRCGKLLISFMFDPVGHQWQYLILIKYYIYTFYFRKMNPFQTGTRLVLFFLSNIHNQ